MKRLLYLLIYIGLALTMGCSKPDRSKESDRLQEELVELGARNPEVAVERVDSAERAGVFTAACANTVKALIYENTGRRRMAAYYAEKAIDANAGMAVSTPADSSLFYTARWILADVAYANGEYGKSIALAKEILTFVENGASLTAEQQLYRRLCTLMAEQQPYTDENLNRETLAQLLGTNAKYVVQTIRECSQGETVGDFITRYRLEHVAHLLKTTDDPIGVVGELSGIPSRVTLSRLFRNAYGMTCREYRQVSQQKE